MENKAALLRSLPKVDDLLKRVLEENGDISRNTAKWVIQEEISRYREMILKDDCEGFAEAELFADIRRAIALRSEHHLRQVINATGVILHTNLGRARLAEECERNMVSVATGYSNLEYNLETGSRGSRYDHVEELLVRLTGAEAALVVNNNAAAVYLILDSLAKGQEVIVSRGELVEIGGSFRVPAIMEASGCALVEVGTTNKTHAYDYEGAIRATTGALLKVHTSNYQIIGFTESVEVSALAEIAHDHDLPLIYDHGSGLLADLGEHGLTGELTVAQSVAAGADLVCFSGDKLLGGPQAGIIVGSKAYIQSMKKNHLLRALRIDKFTLAALETTLRQYIDPELALETIPTLKMMTEALHQVKARAEGLASQLKAAGWQAEVLQASARVGGGSLPTTELPSYAVAIKSPDLTPNQLEYNLRRGKVPIICRIAEDSVQFDLRTVTDAELQTILQSLQQIKSTLPETVDRGAVPQS